MSWIYKLEGIIDITTLRFLDSTILPPSIEHLLSFSLLHSAVVWIRLGWFVSPVLSLMRSADCWLLKLTLLNSITYNWMANITSCTHMIRFRSVRSVRVSNLKPLTYDRLIKLYFIFNDLTVSSHLTKKFALILTGELNYAKFVSLRQVSRRCKCWTEILTKRFVFTHFIIRSGSDLMRFLNATIGTWSRLILFIH